MKLDDALLQTGEVFFWGKAEAAMLSPASYRGRSTGSETGSLASRILCKRTFIKIPNWNCSILSLFIVPDPGTPFGLERIETWVEPRPRRSRRGPQLRPDFFSFEFVWVLISDQ